MARYSISNVKTTGAAAGMICQLRSAGSSRDSRVYEIGIFVATAVAGRIGLYRPTNVGSGFTSTGTGAPHDNVSGAGASVVDTAATTAPTIPANALRTVQLPATIGAGVVFPFPNGIVVPALGALNLHQLSADAVTYSFYFDYDE